MILRVFAFIWCANLVTLLLFLVLINLVDLSPPEDIQIRAETAVLEQQVSEIYRKDGKAGALAFWQLIAPGFPSYALEPDAGCTDRNVIGAADQGCLRLSRKGSITERLLIFQPAALPLTIGALVSAIMATFLSRWLTSPIRGVSQGLKAIAAGRWRPAFRPNSRPRTASCRILEGILTLRQSDCRPSPRAAPACSMTYRTRSARRLRAFAPQWASSKSAPPVAHLLRAGWRAISQDLTIW